MEWGIAQDMGTWAGWRRVQGCGYREMTQDKRDIGCVGRTLGMHCIVTWGLGRMGTWLWGHGCDWGGHGLYRGYRLVLGPLKHPEAM